MRSRSQRFSGCRPLRAKSFVAVLLLAAWLPAGAQQEELRPSPQPAPPPQPFVAFVPSPEKPLRKIGVLSIVPSRQVEVWNDNPAAIAFGIIPALIYSGVQVGKSRDYVAEMNRQKKTLAPELAQLLQRELSRKYEAVFLRQRPGLKEDKSADYSKIQTDADAILSVFYGKVGYRSSYTDKDFYPVVILGARLLDAQTKETLYYKLFAVHPGAGKMSPDKVEAVHPGTRYIFRTFDALMGEFERSIEGLLAAQEILALRLLRDLGVPPPEQPAGAAPKETEPPPAETPAPKDENNKGG